MIEDSSKKDMESDNAFERGITSGKILTLPKMSRWSINDVVTPVMPFLKKRKGIRPQIKKRTQSTNFVSKIIGKTRE